MGSVVGIGLGGMCMAVAVTAEAGILPAEAALIAGHMEVAVAAAVVARMAVGMAAEMHSVLRGQVVD
jgi:hypothetical protein